MPEDFALAPTEAQLLAARRALQACNEKTARCGLALSEAQAAALVLRRYEALRETGRVEFGGGILPALIDAFCDSPFITQENYEATLGDLQALFYHLKNESLERVSDADLIVYMQTVFDGRAQGALDVLADVAQERLCRYARGGAVEDEREEADDDDGE